MTAERRIFETALKLERLAEQRRDDTLLRIDLLEQRDECLMVIEELRQEKALMQTLREVARKAA